MSDTPILQLHEISKQFEAAASLVVNHVSLSLKTGEILGLLGPSGCGKTTLLRLIAGFEQPQSGWLELSGRVIVQGMYSVPPEDRDIGMVFQDYALFPHLTVAQNVAFGLNQPRRRKFSSQQAKKLTQDAIDLVGLSGFEQRYPHELSGGQQQRVALARALAPQPTMILLDEPLSNLDVQVRLRLRQEIRRILKMTNTAAIFVTHDQEEAMAICDRVAIMCQGKLEQVGPPEELYHHPQSRFVADFVTQANFLPATLQENQWHTEVGHFPAAEPLSSTCEIMIRQEDVQLKPDASSRIVVRDRQFLGREYQYCAVLPSGHSIYVRAGCHNPIQEGSYVQLCVDPEMVQVFPAAS
jgi:iron(III) transport system ATP-binding protein